MDTSLSDPLLGRVLDGRYRVEARIAPGGMGTVYMAVDLRLDRRVAVKVMHPGLAEDPGFIARFQREAKAAARISNPNVVAVTDAGRDGDVVFLVMEYVPGRTLREVLRDRGRLTPGQALEVLEPMAAALRAAHQQGIVHYDVKPENVLLGDDGLVKITDFGLARAVASPSVTAAAGMLIGTAAYLAPEQVEGHAADARVDVYAAGVVLWEMLVGRPPYEGDNPWSVANRHVNHEIPPPSTALPGVPVALDRLCLLMTARRPELRLSDGTALHTQVAAAAREVSATVGTSPTVALRRPGHGEAAKAGGARAGGARAGEGAGTGLVEGAGERGTGAPVDAQGTTVLDLDAPRGREAADTTLIGTGRRGVGAGLTEAGAAGAGLAGAGAGRRDTAVIDSATTVLAAPTRHDTAILPTGDAATVSPTAPDGQATGAPPGRPPSGRGDTAVIAQPPRRRRRRRRWIAFWVVLLLLVSAALGVGGWWLGSGRFTSTPALTGLSLDEAKATARHAHLNVALDPAEFSENVPVDKVVSQKPAAKHRARRGSTVHLALSKGPDRTSVPADLAGKPLADVQQELTASRLTVGTVTYDYNEQMPANTVTSVSVGPDAKLKPGTAVDLAVSRGPAPVQIIDVSNRSLDDAQAALTDQGLKTATSEDFSDTVDKGDVIGTDPVKGTTVDKGSTVTIVVSKGPQLFPVPNVQGKSRQDATAALTAAGFAVGNVIDVPAGPGKVIQQRPGPNSQERRGTKVTLYIW